MKVRNLVVIILLLGVAGAAVYFLNRTILSPKDPLEGKLLFTDLPVNDVASFELKSADNAVQIQISDGRWVVSNRSGYPADYDKVAKLLRGLKEATVMRGLQGSPEELSRVALKDPDSEARPAEKGARLLLKDQKGTTVLSILIGSERKANDKAAAPGRFVKLSGENKIYLITGEYYLFDANPAEWLDHKIVDVHPDNIRIMSCYTNDTNEKVFSFERDRKEDKFKSTGKEYNFNPSEVELLSYGLYQMAMEDVVPADPEQPAHLNCPFVFEFVTFDDVVYRVYPSQSSPDSPQGKYSLRLDGACITITGDKDCLKRAEALHRQLRPWIFKVNAQYYVRFFPQPHDTAQPAPAPPAAGK